MMAACFQKRAFNKKTILLEEGEVCDFVGFIASGVFRFYHIREGDEKVTGFFFPADFLSNYRSFLTEGSSRGV